MRRSNFFIPFKENVNEDGAVSAVYMEKNGMTHMLGAGMYTHLPLGYKLFQNLKLVLNKHLYDAGCGEHQFPALQPVSLWEASGRLEIFGKSIFRFHDQHGREVCIAPTHEVAAAFTAKQFVSSYRDLPFRISQIQTKFRDETRPRGGVLRTREFTMHDLYAFDVDREAGEIAYEAIKQAYIKTLIEIRLPFIIHEQSDMGQIGGIKSHEFHVLTDIGEDRVPGFDGKLHNSLEIAHIFMLGDKYTAPINARFQNKEGKNELIFMSSFGLGIERTVAAYVEKNYQAGKDMLWSWALAPFKIGIIGNHPDMWPVYYELSNNGKEILIDDRNSSDVSFSTKLREGFNLGLPIYLIYGKSYANDGLVEVKVPIMNKKYYIEPEKILEEIERLTEIIKAIELGKMQFSASYWSDVHNKLFVRIEDHNQLKLHYCERLEVPKPLLGNFGDKSSFNSAYMLRAENKSVLPVIIDPNSKENPQKYVEGIRCLVGSEWDPNFLDKLNINDYLR